MKILLANSPWYKKGYYGVRAGSRWPHFERCGVDYMPFPFFLAYATAVLEKHGFDVLLIDAIAEKINYEKFYKKVADYAPDVVVYEVSTPSINVDLEVAKQTKEILGSNKKIIFCGPHFFMYNTQFLDQQRDVDMVIYGEYEITLLETIRRLVENRDVKDVLGVIYRDELGMVRMNPRRSLIEDLDSLPRPSRHFLPMHNYCDTLGGIPRPSVPLWASRGCPFRCIFCFWPQVMYNSHAYRTRNPVDVVDEIEYLVKEYNFKSFYFDDDTFNIGKARMLAICSELRKRNIKLPWAIMARADTMDEELLLEMRKVGLYALKYGVESSSQKILERCKKNLDLGKVKKIVEFTRRLGILYHLTFTFGLPGETKKTIKETIDFAIKLRPDSVQFSIATPFPGTEYYDLLTEEGHIISNNWEDYDGCYKAVVETAELSVSDLEKAVRQAYRKWDWYALLKKLKRNPARILKKLMLHPVYSFRRMRNGK